MYATSRNFMDHFGLSSVKDLPKLKDIQSIGANEIGMPSDMNDSPNDEEISEAENINRENTVTEESSSEFQETIIEYDIEDSAEAGEEGYQESEPEKE